MTTTAMLHSYLLSLRQIGLPSALATVLLIASAALCLFIALYAKQTKLEWVATQASLKQAKRQSAIARQFQPPFEQLRSVRQEIPNTRVRWTDRLATELAEFNARFIIEDPLTLARIPNGAHDVITLLYYPIRILAELRHDQELVEFLTRLQIYGAKLLENRSCQISAQANEGSLQLNCLYALYEFDIPREPAP